MGIRAKSVSGIKTLASLRGSGAHSSERHVHQFKIASLELERSRRAQERLATLHRLKNLEERLAGIDAQIREHQEALGQRPARPGDSKPEPGPEPKAEAGGKRHTLRY